MRRKLGYYEDTLGHVYTEWSTDAPESVHARECRELGREMLEKRRRSAAKAVKGNVTVDNPKPERIVCHES